VARTLTITAAEWASITADGALWIVREQDSINITDMTGAELNDGGFAATTFYRPGPPAEFVAACAPCETCEGHRSLWHIGTVKNGRPSEWRPCPDCSIELVGPCPQVKGCPAGMAPLSCGQCHQIVQVGGTVTLGYGYPVGQPLPIVASHECSDETEHVCVGVGSVVHHLKLSLGDLRLGSKAVYTEIDLTDRLAHYGPPETLVGRWAMQMVVAS